MGARTIYTAHTTGHHYDAPPPIISLQQMPWKPLELAALPRQAAPLPGV